MVGKQRGFTIVELRIVIVVIAILVAISIVAYNGIQQRTQTARTLATIDAFEKALRIYYTQHGSFPFAPNNVSGYRICRRIADR